MPIHSDWGDWLPREIAAADPDGVAVWYLGCNGFALKGADGTTVFVDPYLGTGDPPRTVRMIPVPFAPGDVREADAVLATHEHTDHVHGPSQAPILENTDATFYGPGDSVAKARDDENWAADWDVYDEQFVAVSEGDAVEVGEFTVNVEPAHDRDASHPVSYVVEHDTGTFFHGGDTKPGDSFADLGDRYDVDVAVVAFGSAGHLPDSPGGDGGYKRWYCDENQAIEVAAAVEADRLVPSHWDMWKRLTADPAALVPHARGFEHPRRVEIVEVGDRFDL
jgi:L-ascorbate 6-phosphate lactonase